MIEKIQKALSKDGIIKAIKRAQDGYDMEDAFVDDSETVNNNPTSMNLLTPAFDDFICLSGSIEQFRKSDYFDHRIKIARKHDIEHKKAKGNNKNTLKGGKKSGKEVTRKRPEENTDSSKPIGELKKVKKTVSGAA